MSLFDNERDESVRRDRGQPGDPLPANAGGSASEVLLGVVDEVIGEWRSQVDKEPWSKLPAVPLISVTEEWAYLNRRERDET